MVVDDSSSINGEIFNLEEFEGGDWVVISDEVLEDSRRDELPGGLPVRVLGGDPRQRGSEAVDGRGRRRGRRPPPPSLWKRAKTGVADLRPVYYLGIFIPIAVVLELVHAGPVIVSIAAAIGVIPTAAAMGEATEVIASKTGPGIGGFLNVTFGNARS